VEVSRRCLLAKGKTINDALWLEPEDVAREVGGLPENHMHCARLALNVLGEAIADYLERRGKIRSGKNLGHSLSEAGKQCMGIAKVFAYWRALRAREV
jgi:hypothetical protein